MSKTSIAATDIKPAVFVTRDGVSNDYEVTPASTGNFPSGISGDFTEDAPIPSVATTYHAESGNPVTVLDQHGDVQNRTIMLEITATVTRGERLMPDATGDGTAIPATPGHFYGAEALESGSSGERIRVRPIIGVEPVPV